uniref:OTU deubiquitinase 7A n=1 Tax=Cavia porcellus TaxID=10141 RepID=A0A286XIW7_CAVPO
GKDDNDNARLAQLPWHNQSPQRPRRGRTCSLWPTLWTRTETRCAAIPTAITAKTARTRRRTSSARRRTKRARTPWPTSWAASARRWASS